MPTQVHTHGRTCIYNYDYYYFFFYLSLGDFFDGVSLAVGEERLTELLVFIVTVHLTQETMLLGTVQGSEDN